jgi:integrase
MCSGIPDKQAAVRLGHSNVQTLRKTYQHILGDMDKGAADKINNTVDISDVKKKRLTVVKEAK